MPKSGVQSYLPISPSPLSHPPHIRIDDSYTRRRDVIEAFAFLRGNLVPVRRVAQPGAPVLWVRFEVLDLGPDGLCNAAPTLETARGERRADMNVADLRDGCVLCLELSWEAGLARVQRSILAVSYVTS